MMGLDEVDWVYIAILLYIHPTNGLELGILIGSQCNVMDGIDLQLESNKTSRCIKSE